MRKIGVTITGANVTGDIADAGQGAQIIAHENVLDRLSAPTGQKAAAPAGAGPRTLMYPVKRKFSSTRSRWKFAGSPRRIPMAIAW